MKPQLSNAGMASGYTLMKLGPVIDSWQPPYQWNQSLLAGIERQLSSNTAYQYSNHWPCPHANGEINRRHPY